MKTMSRIFAKVGAGVLIAGLALNFSACTEQSPLQPPASEADVSPAALGKKGGNGNGKKQADNTYPQSASGPIHSSQPGTNIPVAISGCQMGPAFISREEH